MIATLRRGLARFWYGPTGAPGTTTILPEDEDEWEESERLADETYRYFLREEEYDEEDRRGSGVSFSAR